MGHTVFNLYSPPTVRRLGAVAAGVAHARGDDAVHRGKGFLGGPESPCVKRRWRRRRRRRRERRKEEGGRRKSEHEKNAHGGERRRESSASQSSEELGLRDLYARVMYTFMDTLFVSWGGCRAPHVHTHLGQTPPSLWTTWRSTTTWQPPIRWSASRGSESRQRRGRGSPRRRY
jgi:hypothetical protein